MKSTFNRVLLSTLMVSVFLLACTKQNIKQTDATTASVVNAQQSILPIMGASNGPEYIAGSYIVVLKENTTKTEVDNDADEFSRKHGFKTEHRFKSSIKGFSGKLSDAAVIALRNDARVAYIEQDQIVHFVTTQSNPLSWGLDRVDQPNLPLDQSYTYTQDGTGVDAYIIDCGILLSHTDFGGRAVTGFDAVTSGGLAIDGNGHGTHVAGTVGGTAYGIAKNVKLIAVRVLDANGSGTISGVIAGVDWVTSDHTTHPAVANMSLGGGVSTALDDAVKRSIADGVTYCIAAGNSAANASTSSPADVPEAITVGATDINDAFAYFSNYGTLVDISAPGVNITSDWLTSNTATNTISGTSMATPHVTGVAALYLQTNPTASPAQIQAAITTNAINGKITSLKTGTVNKLLSSIVGTVPVLPAIPSIPSLVSPANASSGISTATTLSWTPSSDAASYSVQVSTSATFSTIALSTTGIAGTSLSISGLTSNRVYYWRVSATNLGGTSAYSTVFSFTTAVAITTPSSPSLSLPSNNATVVAIPTTLSWNTSTRATSYSVQVSRSTSFTNSNLVYNVSGITATSTLVSTGLLSKTKYYWRVNATNTAGTSSWSNSRNFTTN
jgi:subtilisin family serine protease